MIGFNKGFYSELNKLAAGSLRTNFMAGFKNPKGVDAARRHVNIGRAAQGGTMHSILHPVDTVRATAASLGGKRPLNPQKLNSAQRFADQAKWGARTRKALPYLGAAAATYGAYRLLRNKDDERR